MKLSFQTDEFESVKLQKNQKYTDEASMIQFKDLSKKG